MENKKITYTLHFVEKCNMCQAPSSRFKVLGKRLNQPQGFYPNKKVGLTTTVMRCKDCGLIFSNPQPIPNSISDHYNVDPEKYWKEEYFQLTENYFKGEIEMLKGIIEVRPGMKSLDIGAGLGKQMIALQKHGFDAYGIEPSPSFYKMSIDKMGISKDKVQMRSIEEAEYEENSFDFISFGVVLEHLYNPSLALNKAIKWLKPNGVCHIEVPNADWLIAKMLNAQYRLRGKDYVTNISPMHAPFHLHEFTIDSFRRNGLLNNYEIVKHGQYVCRTTLPRFFDPILKPLMTNTNTGMQLFVWLKKKA